MSQPIVSDAYFLGLSLTELVAVSSGLVGMVTGVVALVINYLQHRHTKKLRKPKFISTVAFKQRKRTYGTELLHELEIKLHNRGYPFYTEFVRVYVKPLPLMKRRLFAQIGKIQIAAPLEAADYRRFRHDLDKQTPLDRFATIEVETRAGEFISVRARGWAKARKDILAWRAEHS